MLNAEKYKDKIVEHKGVFGVSPDGEFIICMSANCQDGKCIFNTPGSCFSARILWAVEETQKQSHEEVLKILKQCGGIFAIDEKTGEVDSCHNTDCNNCALKNERTMCAEQRYKWLVKHGFIK